MFYFRLNKVKILDNRERARLLGLLSRDRAEVEFVSLVTTGNDDFPSLDELVATSDPARRRTLVRDLVQTVAASRLIRTVKHVKDGHVFTFGDVGYALYVSPTIPDDFNVVLLGIERDDDERDLAATVFDMVSDEEFDAFSTNLLTLLSQAANPVWVAGVQVSRFVVRAWSKWLMSAEDDQVGPLYMSLNRAEHYRHGKRDKQDVPDLTGNMFIDYTIFAAEPDVPPLPA
ncbi:MAG: hypothetical protein AAF970_12580 [Bacteroidota bacterium]